MNILNWSSPSFGLFLFQDAKLKISATNFSLEKFDSTGMLLYNDRSLPQRKLAGVNYVNQLSRPWVVARSASGEVKIGEIMKYAIFEAGGKQYRAEEGKTLSVDLLTAKVGEAVTLDKVLMVVDGDAVTVGAPYIKGAKLDATVEEHYRRKKILVFKYKPKIDYRRKAGHRQQYTRLLVQSIVME